MIKVDEHFVVSISFLVFVWLTVTSNPPTSVTAYSKPRATAAGPPLDIQWLHIRKPIAYNPCSHILPASPTPSILNSFLTSLTLSQTSHQTLPRKEEDVGNRPRNQKQSKTQPHSPPLAAVFPKLTEFLPASHAPKNAHERSMRRLLQPQSSMGQSQIRHVHLLGLRRHPPRNGRARFFCSLGDDGLVQSR